MISNSVPFFEPFIITSQYSNKESFAILGRFAENLLNVRTTYRTHTVTFFNENDRKVEVAIAKEERRHWIKCAAKIALLVIIFPVTFIALGIKGIYRKVNQFIIVPDNRFDAPQPAQTKAPIQAEVSEKLAKEEPTIEKISYKKLSLDELYAKGQEAVKAENHKEVVECFGRFCIMSSGKKDKRKKTATDLFYTHLKKYDPTTKIPKEPSLDDFKKLFAHFKEHSLITDVEHVKTKISTLGKVTLAPAKVKSDVVTDLTSIVSESNGHKIILADSEQSKLRFKYAAYTAQGERKFQEDSCGAVEITIKQAGKEEINACLFMVADGHDGGKKGQGKECSRFVVDNLARLIQENLNSKTSLSDLDVMNALKLASVRLNDEWGKSKSFDNLLGSTLCFALTFKDPVLGQDVVWVGNVGDTRVVADLDHTAIQLTTDANWREENEDKNSANKQFLMSVKIRDGSIAADNRLKGVEPLRVIGHNKHKGFSARPEIQKLIPSKYEQCRLWMFSDGVGEVIGSEEIVSMTTKVKTVQEASNRLVAIALARGGSDNTTAICIDLKR